jgi:hypothetical protein
MIFITLVNGVLDFVAWCIECYNYRKSNEKKEREW